MLTDRIEGTHPPVWAKDAVFYHIFPDSFARSDRVPKPSNLLAWDAAPTVQGYFGGDLLGIVERLDHVAELGANAIYLTPIFQSASNHRYHTHDYERVDPLLGGNRALRELVEAVHRRGMRIVLDGVFNHASRGFFRFNDILENGPHSPWLDWFLIEDWPLAPYVGEQPANYTSWYDNRALPKFNTDNPQVRDYLFGIGEYWLREYDIDGWRLDVPEEIKTPGFWEEFSARARAVKQDAYLVGEIWHAAPEWLRGDRFDATMNYEFAAAVIAFAAGDRVSEELARGRSYRPAPGIDARGFGQRIQGLHDQYDWETVQVEFNLISSHDAPRVLSLARGDRATLRLATLLQMTLPGAPSIYYGDEIALRGASEYDGAHRDADARWPFPWHDRQAWDLETLEYFRRAVALRHAYPVLRRGRFEQLYAGERCYAYLRSDDRQALLVAVNAGDQAHAAALALPERLARLNRAESVFGDGRDVQIAGGQVQLRVGRRSGIVLALSESPAAP